MLKAARYKFLLFMALAKYTRGQYLAAENYATRVMRLTNSGNVKISLFAAYLSVLQGDEALAKKWLEEFYGAILSSDSLFEDRGYNESEKNWVLIFAEYLLLMLTSKGVEQLSGERGVLRGDAKRIEFCRVRGIIRRMFPPAHLLTIKEYFAKHGLLA